MTKINKSLHDLWRSTFLRRWHRNPDLAHTPDTLAGHQGRVALIIDHYWPNCRKELIVAALKHDLQETRIGDVCGQAKRDFPSLSFELDKAEAQIAKDMGLCVDLMAGEIRKLKWADKLDAYLWAQHHAPHVLERADWQAQAKWLDLEAESLGLLNKDRSAA